MEKVLVSTSLPSYPFICQVILSTLNDEQKSILYKIGEFPPEAEVWHEFYSSGADHTAPVKVANKKVSEDQHQEQQQQKRAQRHASGKDGEATTADAGAAGNKCHFIYTVLLGLPPYV